MERTMKLLTKRAVIKLILFYFLKRTHTTVLILLDLTKAIATNSIKKVFSHLITLNTLKKIFAFTQFRTTKIFVKTPNSP